MEIDVPLTTQKSPPLINMSQLSGLVVSIVVGTEIVFTALGVVARQIVKNVPPKQACASGGGTSIATSGGVSIAASIGCMGASTGGGPTHWPDCGPARSPKR